MNLAGGMAGAVEVAADTQTRAACLTPGREVRRANAAHRKH